MSIDPNTCLLANSLGQNQKPSWFAVFHTQVIRDRSKIFLYKLDMKQQSSKHLVEIIILTFIVRPTKIINNILMPCQLISKCPFGVFKSSMISDLSSKKMSNQKISVSESD